MVTFLVTRIIENEIPLKQISNILFSFTFINENVHYMVETLQTL